MPIGRESLRSEWITRVEGRSFEVLLLAYHPREDIYCAHHPGVRLFEYPGFKWWMIHELFSRHPEILDQYASFFFLDDDIEITERQIQTLFQWVERLPVQLAQPSLTADSHMSWPVLRHRSWSGYRWVTAVELMCPIMKREALRLLLPTFTLTRSGWGVDLLWGKQVAEVYGPRSMVVFDAVQVRHGKPVGKGELYTRLPQPARQEEEEVRSRFGILDFQIEEVSRSLIDRLRTYLQVKLFWPN